MAITKGISRKIKKGINMSKQTAVDFLVDVIFTPSGIVITKQNNPNLFKLLEQAKEMEKQQKAKDWQEGYNACEFHNDYENLKKKQMNNPFKIKL